MGGFRPDLGPAGMAMGLADRTYSADEKRLPMRTSRPFDTWSPEYENMRKLYQQLISQESPPPLQQWEDDALDTQYLYGP